MNRTNNSHENGTSGEITSTSERRSSAEGSSAPHGGRDFIALRVSYELIEALAPIVPAIERSARDLADQIRRAASSVSLNLAEGEYSLKGNRQKHFAIAHGSANEVKAALRVAKAWGWLRDSDRATGIAFAILDRLLALMWRLTRPAGRAS